MYRYQMWKHCVLGDLFELRQHTFSRDASYPLFSVFPLSFFSVLVCNGWGSESGLSVGFGERTKWPYMTIVVQFRVILDLKMAVTSHLQRQSRFLVSLVVLVVSAVLWCAITSD